MRQAFYLLPRADDILTGAQPADVYATEASGAKHSVSGDTLALADQLQKAPFQGCPSSSGWHGSDCWDPAKQLITLIERMQEEFRDFSPNLEHLLKRDDGRQLFVSGEQNMNLMRLPWELIWCENEFPVLKDKWQIARCLRILDDPSGDTSSTPGLRAARLHEASSLRVLVIVGSLAMGRTKRAAGGTVQDTINALRKALEGDLKRHNLTFHVAAHPSLEHKHALDCSEQGELAARIAAILSEDGGYDIVHFVGHSAAAGADYAKSLMFSASEGNKELSLPIEDFAAALQPTDLQPTEGTRLVVLHACRIREYIAEQLLPVVDHVVAMGAMVPPEIGKAFSKGFYGALAEGKSVGFATNAGRKAIGELEDPKLRSLNWLPIHWTAVWGDAPFLDPERSVLVAYLKHVEKNNRKLHWITKDPFKLEVGVELSIQPNVDSDAATDGDEEFRTARRLDDSHVVADLLGDAKNLTSPGNSHHCWAILGKPGSGKTTVLRLLAREQALACARALARGEDLAQFKAPMLIPIIGKLRSFDGLSPNDSQLRTWLEFVIFDVAITGTRRKMLLDLLEQAAKNGQAVLMFDGLDEVVEHLEIVNGLLRVVSSEDWTTPVLVTSRPFEFNLQEHADFAVARLLDLSYPQRRDLLGAWFENTRGKGADAERLADLVLEKIGISGRVFEMAGTPLFLVLMAVSANDDDQAGTTISFPDRRHEFLDKIIRTLARGRHRPDPQAPASASLNQALAPLNQTIAVLRWVACSMIESPGANHLLRPAGKLLADCPPDTLKAALTEAMTGHLHRAAEAPVIVEEPDQRLALRRRQQRPGAGITALGELCPHRGPRQGVDPPADRLPGHPPSSAWHSSMPCGRQPPSESCGPIGQRAQAVAAAAASSRGWERRLSISFGQTWTKRGSSRSQSTRRRVAKGEWVSRACTSTRSLKTPPQWAERTGCQTTLSGLTKASKSPSGACTKAIPPVMPAAKLSPTDPKITAVPPVMYSQPLSPQPSTTAKAPELRTQKRSPARPAAKSVPEVAP